MTIQERQKAAETWANARADWEAADRLAENHDRLRLAARTRMDDARIALEKAANVGPNIRTRVFALLREVGDEAFRVVKVTYKTPLSIDIELLKTEPNE